MCGCQPNNKFSLRTMKRAYLSQGFRSEHRRRKGPRFLRKKSGTLQERAPGCNLVYMPELPDITAYIGALEKRVIGQPLVQIRVASAFLLRTAQPSIAD